MVHDPTYVVAENPEGYSQAVFLGWLGLGLIGLMAVFTVFILGSAAAAGFH